MLSLSLFLSLGLITRRSEGRHRRQQQQQQPKKRIHVYVYIPRRGTSVHNIIHTSEREAGLAPRIFVPKPSFGPLRALLSGRETRSRRTSERERKKKNGASKHKSTCAMENRYFLISFLRAPGESEESSGKNAPVSVILPQGVRAVYIMSWI